MNLFNYKNNKKKILEFLVKDIDELIDETSKSRFKTSSKKFILTKGLNNNNSTLNNNNSTLNNNIVLIDNYIKKD